MAVLCHLSQERSYPLFSTPLTNKHSPTLKFLSQLSVFPPLSSHRQNVHLTYISLFPSPRLNRRRDRNGVLSNDSLFRASPAAAVFFRDRYCVAEQFIPFTRTPGSMHGNFLTDVSGKALRQATIGFQESSSPPAAEAPALPFVLRRSVCLPHPQHKTLQAIAAPLARTAVVPPGNAQANFAVLRASVRRVSQSASPTDQSRSSRVLASGCLA